MTERTASVLVADEILYSLTGKCHLQGIYTGDIVIAQSQLTAVQLVVLFMVETDLDDPFKSITLEVVLPGDAPRYMSIEPPQLPPMPGRSRVYFRWPFLINMPVLRPGRIEARVLHEKGATAASGLWISQATPPQRTH